LRWQIIDHLSLRKIALLRGVSVSNISQDYERLKAHLLFQLRGLICQRAGVPLEDVASVSAFASQPPVTLATADLRGSS
jgi:hypothetical protein